MEKEPKGEKKMKRGKLLSEHSQLQAGRKSVLNTLTPSDQDSASDPERSASNLRLLLLAHCGL